MAPLGAVSEADLPLLLMKVPLARAMIGGSWPSQSSGGLDGLNMDQTGVGPPKSTELY